MPYIDFLFFAAALTMGWGLSLASYRIFAVRNDWPMGELHANKPLVPILLGAFAIVIAVLFAAARQAAPGGEFDGWWIFVGGLVFAFVWTGTMRVGSQVSLFLAPLATLILVVSWIGVRAPPGLATESGFVTNSYVANVPLPARRPAPSASEVRVSPIRVRPVSIDLAR